MIIASNFKTNHTSMSTIAYMKTLITYMEQNNLLSHDVLVFPPATALNIFEKPECLKLGVQNAYPVEKGSFTGEIGLQQIEEYEINTILIGHSERRHILKESQELIKEKYDFFKEKNFTIVYCIGEPKEIREEGIQKVLEYNLSQLEGIDINYKNLIVAYEPVWAIGTGLTASIEQIDETLTALKESVKSPLLYGGSVKVENTKEILSISNCDGILVGTASWDVKNFQEMIKIAHTI